MALCCLITARMKASCRKYVVLTKLLQPANSAQRYKL